MALCFLNVGSPPGSDAMRCRLPSPIRIDVPKQIRPRPVVAIEGVVERRRQECPWQFVAASQLEAPLPRGRKEFRPVIDGQEQGRRSCLIGRRSRCSAIAPSRPGSGSRSSCSSPEQISRRIRGCSSTQRRVSEPTNVAAKYSQTVAEMKALWLRRSRGTATRPCMSCRML